MALSAPAESGEVLSTSDLRYYRQIAEEEIKNSLEAVEGTAAVKVSGGLEEEIQVRRRIKSNQLSQHSSRVTANSKS